LPDAFPVNLRVPLDQLKARPSAELLKLAQRPASFQEAGAAS
jgi:hypothetical protein